MRKLQIEYQGCDGVLCVYEFDYPSEKELLEIFPEAKEIIPLKIKEWEKRKKEIIKRETIPYLKKCNALKDEFAKVFWKEVYGYLAGGFNEIIRQLKRLRRLEFLISAPTACQDWDTRIQAAKETPIAELHNFKRLRKSGRSYTCCCPIHDDRTPSFHIYDNNTWYCFGCNRGGDSIDFVRQLHGFDFRRAVSYLAGGVT